MKPTNTRLDEYSWKCIWIKKCGYEAYESYNGTLHWFKKKVKKRLDLYQVLCVYLGIRNEKKILN